MKVILSRKGFDSANGGIVSPIFEDGTMISFPIPSKDKDEYSDLQYNEITYTDILDDLKYSGGASCHLDPDIDESRRITKVPGWKPIFGQIGSSASYLMKTVQVQPGDIFLFFGNFHKVEKKQGKYRYIHGSGDFYQDKDLQVIWGYLQIGDIISVPEEQRKYSWHPHSCESRTKKDSNIMFIASDQLSFNEDMPGAGILKYDKKRVLTLEGANKATWTKKSIYDIENVIGNRHNSAKNPSSEIYYAGIWQELGLRESAECTRFAKDIVL